MKHSILITICLLYILFLFSCKTKEKPCCNNGNIVKVPQLAVDYFYFKEGSWWVYEDEITKEQDCVWVCYSKLDTLDSHFLQPKCDCLYGNCYQNLHVCLVSKKLNVCRNNNSYLDYHVQKRGNDPNDRVFEFLEFSGMNNNVGLYRFYWMQDGTFDPDNGFYAKYTDTTNIQLNSNHFSECIYYSYPKGAPAWEWQSASMYAKGVGLVSYTRNGGNQWNIKRYHIIQ